MTERHHYTVIVELASNAGQGTADYKSYHRMHRVTAEGKPEILGPAKAWRILASL